LYPTPRCKACYHSFEINHITAIPLLDNTLDHPSRSGNWPKEKKTKEGSAIFVTRQQTLAQDKQKKKNTSWKIQSSNKSKEVLLLRFLSPYKH